MGEFESNDSKFKISRIVEFVVASVTISYYTRCVAYNSIGKKSNNYILSEQAIICSHTIILLVKQFSSETR